MPNRNEKGQFQRLSTETKVELSSLGITQRFKYQGRTYSRQRAGIGGIRALSRKGDKLITLPPETLVTPVK